MAGHFGLDNLVLIYDNNAVTLDGGIEACFTEDVNSRFRACGWDVIDVYDGSNDVCSPVSSRHRAHPSYKQSYRRSERRLTAATSP